MNLSEIIKAGIKPALALLPAKMDTPAARVMLLAIGLQESRFVHRRQIGGPARGFWQFEKGGGVLGVLTHPSSRDAAHNLCAVRNVAPLSASVYAALETDDVLAAGFARLLLWTDPWRLPTPGDADGAWDLYLRTWRPGKPHPQTWPGLYHQAVVEVAP
ncbi:hypothetical protein CEY09_30335 [Achromobacter marplatensis]|uniref:Uncharacterized protein n=1 Tax=Achromobacter marplatensis TaxID=470868 RepID=A0ABX9FZJ3_9BURK|nr:hypothetical protein [Achromobacter marplatensis]OWT55588.1 hypothetical protein CEY09_30335 [Achromobacter marplatensis]RBP11251.1 hypothetical protein DFP87_12312 [Achromobacter marplatensis]CAB3712544.1 hypothetical protein LMG26219_06011 [Achromobacter marplatensis]